jgi:translation initiation factor IF-2
MAKTVINLVKFLGAKNTTEVLALLEQVGVDTKAEGFGVMTSVDDSVIEKVQSLKGGAPAVAAPQKESSRQAPAAAATTTRRKPVEEPVNIDLSRGSGGARPAATRDFFGARPAEQAPAQSSSGGDGGPVILSQPEPEASRAAPAGAQTAAARSAAPAATSTARKVQQPQASAAAPAAAPPQAPPAPQPASASRPDLSSGPRIISMPDPAERARAAAQAQRAAAGGGGQRQAPGTGGGDANADKKKLGARGPVKDRKRDDEGGSRKKRGSRDVEDSEDVRLRSRKRVFKIHGQPSAAGPTVVPAIRIGGPMPLREVASASGVKVAEIVRFLMRELDIMVGINYVASVEEVSLIAEHFGIKYTVSLDQQPESELVAYEETTSENIRPRPPVVTIMGHVDHGKTKLLDTIRTANVVAGEAGGITQHIGAYMVEKKGKHVTFIDTPGHEAFTAMRARGSQVTDIVILVVAADDGVMPQTVEAVQHAKAASVPIIVAVNKMDRADANPDRVKTQLAELGLTPEEWGGDTVFVPVSALKAEGIDELLEMILLTAELADPRADPTALPFGVVIESQVDTGIGVVATVLVQQGTLVKGQTILSGTSVGRIKRMENDKGEEIEEAGPSVPARIIGFAEPPENGDKIYAFKSKKQAQAIADQREAEARVHAGKSSGRMSLEKFLSKAETSEVKELNVIVKADVGGSAEALRDSLRKIEVEGAHVNVISTGVGQINETDVNLAAASDAVVIGFHVGVSLTARRIAEREHIELRMYDIIYKVTEDIELAMKGMLDPELVEQPVGRVEVRAIFKADRGPVVAGGYVLDGVARRNVKFRMKREGKYIFENGTLASLRRFKDDVREVASGYECGFLLETPGVTPQEGDVMELYEVVAKARF